MADSPAVTQKRFVDKQKRKGRVRKTYWVHKSQVNAVKNFVNAVNASQEGQQS